MVESEHQEYVDEVASILDCVAGRNGVTIDVDEDEIAEQLAEYIEARTGPTRGVKYVARNIVREETDIDDVNQAVRECRSGSPPTGSNPQLRVADITAEGEWIDFEGIVIRATQPDTEDLIQVGWLADGTGAIRYTIWEGADIDAPLDVGESYRLDPILTTTFDGRHELTFRSATEVTHLTGDDAFDIDPESYTQTLEGVLVDMQAPMGLIDRCPDCNNVLTQATGTCPECGEFDGEPDIDLRIKAILDDGEQPRTVYIGTDPTEALTGCSLADAQDLEEEYGTRDAVRQYLEAEAHGSYVRIEGQFHGSGFHADRIERLEPPTITDLNDLAKKLGELPEAAPDDTGHVTQVTTDGRNPARRAFAWEYKDATLQERFGSGDRAPVYQLLPTGAWANRLFIVGELAEVVEESSDELYVHGEVTDPTGRFKIGAGERYEEEVAKKLLQCDPPEKVAIIGKTALIDGDRSTATKLRAKNISPVTDEEYDNWVRETARATLRRLNRFSDEGNDAAQAAANEYGAEPDEYRDAAIEALERLQADIKEDHNPTADQSANASSD